jgi:Holin family.
METSNKIVLTFLAVITAIAQGCINSIEPVLYALIIFSLVTLIDLVTGIQASKFEGKRIESRPMRNCFRKWLIYIGVFVGTMIIGVVLSLLAAYTNAGDGATARGLLLNILKWQAIVATYIEVLSISENLHRRYPDNVYLSILYYVLSVQIKNQIPMLKDYFSQKKTNNNINNQDQSKQL